MPPGNRLATLADFFCVTIDYIMGRTNQNTLVGSMRDFVLTLHEHFPPEQFTLLVDFATPLATLDTGEPQPMRLTPELEDLLVLMAGMSFAHMRALHDFATIVARRSHLTLDPSLVLSPHNLP